MKYQRIVGLFVLSTISDLASYSDPRMRGIVDYSITEFKKEIRNPVSNFIKGHLNLISEEEQRKGISTTSTFMRNRLPEAGRKYIREEFMTIAKPIAEKWISYVKRISEGYDQKKVLT
jgi:hypothetical protein